MNFRGEWLRLNNPPKDPHAQRVFLCFGFVVFCFLIFIFFVHFEGSGNQSAPKPVGLLTHPKPALEAFSSFLLTG